MRVLKHVGIWGVLAGCGLLGAFARSVSASSYLSFATAPTFTDTGTNSETFTGLGTITLTGVTENISQSDLVAAGNTVDFFTVALTGVSPNNASLIGANFTINLSETNPSSGSNPSPTRIVGLIGHINPVVIPPVGQIAPPVDPILAVTFAPITIGNPSGVTTTFSPTAPFEIYAPSSAGTVPLDHTINYAPFTVRAGVMVIDNTAGGPTPVPVPASAWGTSALLGMLALMRFGKKTAA
ncbi:MAG TPA: hypothetical protein VIM11_02010 [Tepidisphaeraceae bacterium]|jgi:hypothetical protein